jgi:hypothetical protein
MQPLTENMCRLYSFNIFSLATTHISSVNGSMEASRPDSRDTNDSRLIYNNVITMQREGIQGVVFLTR